jgi:hypothetical protein
VKPPEDRAPLWVNAVIGVFVLASVAGVGALVYLKMLGRW